MKRGDSGALATGAASVASSEIRRKESGIAAARRQGRVTDRFLFIAWVLAGLLLVRNTASGEAIPSGLGATGYAVALVVVVAERRAAIRLIQRSLPLVLVILVGGLSALWSSSPDVAAVQALHLLGSSLIALALVCRFGLRGFLETIALLSLLEAALSIVVVVLLPSSGLMETGEWRGISTQKNELGIDMLCGVAAVVCLGASRRLSRFQFAALVFFAILIIGSQSMESLIVACSGLLILWLALWCRAKGNTRPLWLLLSTILIAAIIVSVLGIDLSGLLTLAGRDPTLTGRTELWQILGNAIRDRPILGFGYGVYWSDSGPGWETTKMVGWDTALEAHNGYIEVLLDTGLVGGVCLLYLLSVGLRRSVVMFWHGHDRLTAWPALMILFSCLANIAAASFEHPHQLSWILDISAFLFSTDEFSIARSRASLSMHP